MSINGVLVVDKPAGLTSHDVVAAARRALGERRIGHTGTLDPFATGVLPLACGSATRLVRFLAASDKDYEATIRFGLTTDTYDITGRECTRSDRQPSLDEVERALASLRGEYDQVPPPYSAKKVAGRRAYELARRHETPRLAPVRVRVSRAELLAFTGTRATVALTCSAGFYVRAFAHALGEITGAGACLEALRRTRSGQFGLEQAVSLDELAAGDPGRFVIPLERLLPEYPSATLRLSGVRRIAHGQDATPDDVLDRTGGPGGADGSAWVRLLHPDGRLVAMATPGRTPGSLHPAVVLI